MWAIAEVVGRSSTNKEGPPDRRAGPEPLVPGDASPGRRGMCGITGFAGMPGLHERARRPARHVRGDRASRPRRGGALRVDVGVARHAPPQHHRPRRRASSRWRTRTARCCVVFNGEIYNYRELRDELAGARPPLRDPQRHRSHRPPLRGVRATASSTRSAACSPSRSGTRGATRLLLAPRPRSASSRCTTGSTAAASPSRRSCRSLLAIPDFPREVDPRGAARDYLAFGYVPDPRASSKAFASCRRATASRGRAGAAVACERYWDAAAPEPTTYRTRRPSRNCGALLRRSGEVCTWSPTCRSARFSRAASTRRRSSRRWRG